MALTKEHIVESIRNHCNLPKRQSGRLFESLLGLMKSTLANGEDILISGFGKFSVKEKKGRPGRNPQAGKQITLPPKKVVTFKCSSVFMSRINEGSGGFSYSELVQTGGLRIETKEFNCPLLLS